MASKEGIGKQTDWLKTWKKMLICLLIFCSCVLLYLVFRNRESAAFSAIPGPKQIPIVGNVWMFLLGSPEHIWLRTHQSLKKEYGSVVKLYAGPKPQIILYGSEGFEKILSNSRHITKGFQVVHHQQIHYSPIGLPYIKVIHFPQPRQGVQASERAIFLYYSP